jgi:uncharacterized membrane protein
MTWYTFFKFVHVIMAVTWVGGATVIQFYALRALGSRDPNRMATFAGDTEWVGTRVFIPASLTLFLAAIGLMVNGHWPWGTLWVDYGLAVFVASFAVGAGFLGPESGRIRQTIEAHGAESPEAQSRIKRILLVSRAELVLLIGVIYAMTVKPTSSNGLGWAIGVAVLMAVAIAGIARSFLATSAAGSAAIGESV